MSSSRVERLAHIEAAYGRLMEARNNFGAVGNNGRATAAGHHRNETRQSSAREL